MADLKGTAVGTLGTTPEERTIKQGTDFAQKLEAMFPLPKRPELDTQAFFQPLLDQINGLKGPAPQAVPDTRLNAGTALGLFAMNQGAQVLGKNSDAFNILLGRVQNAEQIQRENVQAQNAFEQQKQLQYLSVRSQILEAAYNKALEDQKYDLAAKTQERLFVVQSGLDRLAAVTKAANDKALAELDISGKVQVAKISGILDFLARTVRASGESYGSRTQLSANDEANAIKDLVDATNQIDLKLPPQGGFWTFGKAVPSDQEMGAQLRTMAASLYLPSQNVRDLALEMIRGTLQARYGDNTDAKVKFLKSVGLDVLAPTSSLPNTAPIISGETQAAESSAAPASSTGQPSRPLPAARAAPNINNLPNPQSAFPSLYGR